MHRNDTIAQKKNKLGCTTQNMKYLKWETFDVSTKYVFPMNCYTNYIDYDVMALRNIIYNFDMLIYKCV